MYTIYFCIFLLNFDNLIVISRVFMYFYVIQGRWYYVIFNLWNKIKRNPRQ